MAESLTISTFPYSSPIPPFVLHFTRESNECNWYLSLRLDTELFQVATTSENEDPRSNQFILFYSDGEQVSVCFRETEMGINAFAKYWQKNNHRYSAEITVPIEFVNYDEHGKWTEIIVTVPRVFHA